MIRTDAAARDVRRDCRRIQRGVHAPPHTVLTDRDLIRAAVIRAGDGAVVSGMSAAVLHGARFTDHDADIELIRGLTGQGRQFDGVRIMRTDHLAADDVQVVDGLAVTTPVRTAYDIGRRGPAWKALARLDDLAFVSDLDLAELWAYIRDHPHTKGIRQIRDLIQYIEPKSESPRETALRYLIIKSGLPRPEAQIEVFGADGRLIAKLDLGYRRYKIDIEYDGVEHHTSADDRADNAERDRKLSDLGWDTIRVTGQAMSTNPDKVVATIEELLAIRGCRNPRRH
ncbi:Protein of unknown function (DUF559) [Williamsia maris]|uniref:DUF559 domain-containing protein n=1 Tax=Williamsia maris TaxID=72806 RepID=A0ABT1HAI1_9NOCA|nr:Protein of unknown function (DUF559) [Williamsia maris]